MNYFELQIGSIVKINTVALYENFDKYKTKEIDNIWVVRTLGYNVELERLYNPSHETTITVENEHIAPVAINREMLELFGYKQESDSEYVFQSENKACVIEYSSDSRCVFYTAGEGCPSSRKLYYIHQLQLLTMAITGSMLKRPY